MARRLLVVSPVLNEAAHIERVARSVARQTHPPDRWIVVDDGSDDGTPELLQALSVELPFMRVFAAPRPAVASGDRLGAALEVKAFNFGLAQTDWRRFDIIGKLDGDVELPGQFFERLLAAFAADPQLGVAGGRLVEQHGAVSKPVRIPEHHVHGAMKFFTARCFEELGGLRETLGWDTIDETYARMLGYRSRSLPELVARHHRHIGSAQGRLRGRARHGECAYILHYGALWTALRALKVATSRPYGVSGFAFVWGYLQAALVRAPRVDDAEFRRFVQAELRHRLLRGAGAHRIALSFWRSRRA